MRPRIQDRGRSAPLAPHLLLRSSIPPGRADRRAGAGRPPCHRPLDGAPRLCSDGGRKAQDDFWLQRFGNRDSWAHNLIAVIAGCDDTLAPDTTAQLLQAFGVDPAEFFGERGTGRLVNEGWDPSVAYLFEMIRLAEEGAGSTQVCHHSGA